MLKGVNINKLKRVSNKRSAFLTISHFMHISGGEGNSNSRLIEKEKFWAVNPE